MQTSSDACVCERNMYNQTLQSPHLTCLKWNNVQLALASDDAAGPCRRCPEDATGQLFQCVSCDHGFNSSALLLPGYWRTEQTSPYIFQCEFGPEACVGQWGGLDENSLPLWAHGGCGTGYSGITCGSCADDYRRFKTGCEQCPSAPIFQFAFSAGGFALVCLLIIRRSNAALAAPSIAQSLRSGATGTELLITSVRTLLSFVTVQSLIGEIDNAWPGIHGTMFWVYGVTAEISQLIEFMRCVPSINPFRLFTDPDLPFVLLKAIMTIWMPVLLCIGVFLFYTLPHFLRYLKHHCCRIIRRTRVDVYEVKQNYTGPPRKGIEAFADDVIAACVVLFYVAHPAVIRATLTLFPCQDLEGGLRVLKADTGIACMDDAGMHAGVKNFFGFPSLFLLVLLVPCLMAKKLRTKKRADALRDPRVQRRYAWLVRGYGHDSCAWELAVSARKLGVAAAVVFLSSFGPLVQALGCIGVLQLALVAHLHGRPFAEGTQDRLELLSLTASIFTLLAGVVFRAANFDKIGLEVDGDMYVLLTLAVVILNAAVIGYVIKSYLRRMWKERMAVARKAPTPGQDPDDIKALAENHHADLIQRFLQKSRSLEDTTLTLDTMRHQLHHLLLLLPEHAVEMAALLRGTERLGGAVTDTRLRALEVKRKHRNALAPADRVQKAVELEQKKLQLLGLTDAPQPLALEDGGDGPDSSPATPPDQVLAIADSSEPAEGAEYQATKAVTLRKKEQLQQAKKGKSKDKGKDKKPTDDAALEKEKPRKGLPPRLPQLGHAPTLPEPSVASAWRESAAHQLEQRQSDLQEHGIAPPRTALDRVDDVDIAVEASAERLLMRGAEIHAKTAAEHEMLQTPPGTPLQKDRVGKRMTP